MCSHWKCFHLFKLIDMHVERFKFKHNLVMTKITTLLYIAFIVQHQESFHNLWIGLYQISRDGYTDWPLICCWLIGNYLCSYAFIFLSFLFSLYCNHCLWIENYWISRDVNTDGPLIGCWPISLGPSLLHTIGICWQCYDSNIQMIMMRLFWTVLGLHAVAIQTQSTNGPIHITKVIHRKWPRG